MKALHISLIFVLVLLLSILVVSGATVIQTCCYCNDGRTHGDEYGCQDIDGDGNSYYCTCYCDGYEWSGSTVLITSPGEYSLASDIPSNTVISVQTSGVTIEGNVIINSIRGQEDLDLRNFKSPGTKVDVCNDIVNSSVAGIGTVHGNVVDSSVTGIGTVHGNVVRSSVTGIGIARGDVVGSSVTGIGIARGDVVDSSVTGIGIVRGNVIDWIMRTFR